MAAKKKAKTRTRGDRYSAQEIRDKAAVLMAAASRLTRVMQAMDKDGSFTGTIESTIGKDLLALTCKRAGDWSTDCLKGYAEKTGREISIDFGESAEK